MFFLKCLFNPCSPSPGGFLLELQHLCSALLCSQFRLKCKRRMSPGEIYRYRCMCVELHAVSFTVPEMSWGRGRCWRYFGRRAVGYGCADAVTLSISQSHLFLAPEGLHKRTHAHAHACPARLSNQPFRGGQGEHEREQTGTC